MGLVNKSDYLYAKLLDKASEVTDELIELDDKEIIRLGLKSQDVLTVNIEHIEWQNTEPLETYEGTKASLPKINIYWDDETVTETSINYTMIDNVSYYLKAGNYEIHAVYRNFTSTNTLPIAVIEKILVGIEWENTNPIITYQNYRAYLPYIKLNYNDDNSKLISVNTSSVTLNNSEYYKELGDYQIVASYKGFETGELAVHVLEQEVIDENLTIDADFINSGIGYKIDITNKKASISWLDPNIYKNSNFIMPETVTYKDIQFDIDSFNAENCIIQSLTFNSLINEPWLYGTNIPYFYVDENNPYITAIDGIIYNKTMSRLIYFPANRNIEEFRIPNSVTEINNYCFGANKYLKRIIFNDNIEELPENFAYSWMYSSRCEYLKLSNKIKIIYGRTLYDANSLKEIILPSELEEIRKDCDWSYYALPTSLTKITISNSKIINYKFIIYTPPRYNTNGDLINEKYEISNLYVFGRFSNLKHLIVNDNNPIELDSNVFNDNQYFLINLYVPKGCKEIYENTEGWNKFYNIIELDE